MKILGDGGGTEMSGTLSVCEAAGKNGSRSAKSEF